MTGSPEERAVEAARELLLAEIERASTHLRHLKQAGRGRVESCRVPTAARRRDLLDALSRAPGDSPYLDLDSEVVGPWGKP